MPLVVDRARSPTHNGCMMRHDLPFAAPDQVVGLFGGSFDPPHAGHLHVSQEALKRFQLDRVWWLVSPGNPLKPEGPAALDRRMTAARALVRHPRIEVSDLEARIGTRYTGSDAGTVTQALPAGAFRLAHGRGQPGGFPSLAAVGLDHAARSGRGAGASGATHIRAQFEGGPDLSPGKAASRSRPAFGAGEDTGLVLSQRADDGPVLLRDPIARRLGSLSCDRCPLDRGFILEFNRIDHFGGRCRSMVSRRVFLAGALASAGGSAWANAPSASLFPAQRPSTLASRFAPSLGSVIASAGLGGRVGCAVVDARSG